MFYVAPLDKYDEPIESRAGVIYDVGFRRRWRFPIAVLNYLDSVRHVEYGNLSPTEVNENESTVAIALLEHVFYYSSQIRGHHVFDED